MGLYITNIFAYFPSVQFSSVQSLSQAQLFVTPWTTAPQASLSITNSQSLLKLMSIQLVMPFNHLILCYPLLLLPSILPSIRVFSNESVLCIRSPKYWSFSSNISPSNEYSGLISLRMGWLDLLAVQGTLKSLIQHHSLKASILQLSAFFIVQLLPVCPFLFPSNLCACVISHFSHVHESTSLTSPALAPPGKPPLTLKEPIKGMRSLSN